MDGARRLGHQGLDQRLGRPPSPEPRVDAKGTELAAIGVRAECDKADDMAVLDGDPKRVGGHFGIVELKATGQRNGGGDVLGRV